MWLRNVARLTTNLSFHPPKTPHSITIKRYTIILIGVFLVYGVRSQIPLNWRASGICTINPGMFSTIKGEWGPIGQT